MKARNITVLWTLAAVLLATAATAVAAITVETVPVGNPGNAAHGTGYGSVAYEYGMGKVEITAAQYTAFLNAIAATDTYGVFHTEMQTGIWGCADGITRSGTPGGYSYSVGDNWANLPVSILTWADAARFANWLNNGQPTGSQDATTTENGAYTLNGLTTEDSLANVQRNPGWKWALPTNDEWVKAAYYDPTTTSYFNYATSSNAPPNHDKNDYTVANNVNYIYPGLVGTPYYRTPVGALTNSASPYGTFDQSGNVWEYLEGPYPGTTVPSIRGGCYIDTAASISISTLNGWGYSLIDGTVGFRVVAAAAGSGVPGDFNGDLVIDLADVEALWAVRGTTVPPTDPKFDLVPDGNITLADAQKLVTNIIGTSMADTNLSHTVDILDLGNLANKYGQAGGFTDGDTDFNGIIDIMDLGVLANDYGKNFPVGGSVPEPTTLSMLMLAALLAKRRR
jgi:formylglycine-generating enzyme